MNIIYYKANIGNFGDDLNPYILNYLLPDYEKYHDDILLFFIGTILTNKFIDKKRIDYVDFDKKKKIILGSGAHCINNPLKIDSTWEVRFLRGPLSSLAIVKDANSFITDPAYLIRETPIFRKIQKVEKKYKISIMPHFLSLNKINWKEICSYWHINLIDPTDKNLEFTLSEIAQSDVLITEAMHGAIIADAFRIPWKRFNFFYHLDAVACEFKWTDWLFSMKLNINSTSLPYIRIPKIDGRLDLSIIKHLRYKYLEKDFKNLIRESNYQLSNEHLLTEKMDKLLSEIKKVKTIF